MPCDCPLLLPADVGLPPADVSTLGSTMEAMNKRPVTNTMIVIASGTDCRSSADGGPHMTSNFRSDHPDGAHYLLCDVSVHFMAEDVELALYRRLSTIAEGAPAAWPRTGCTSRHRVVS